MSHFSARLAVVAGCAVLLGVAPAAGANVLKSVPGTVRAVAADGTSVGYVTNINSKQCAAPIAGDRQQVVYLNAKTRKSVLLTTIKGCDEGEGPGLNVTSARWLGITGKRVYWVAPSGTGEDSYTAIDVAMPGSKPIHGPQVYQENIYGTGFRFGSLVAWGGLAYANVTESASPNPDACNAVPIDQVGCTPVIVGDSIVSVNAAGGEASVLRNQAPFPKEIQAAGPKGVVLLAPNGTLSLATSSTSTPLAGSTVDQAAMSGSRVVGLRHAGAKVRLGFWSTAGTETGSCTSAPGRSTTPGLAIAGRVAAFATARGIFALNVPSGKKAACHATKVVALHKGEKLAGFALTTTGGLIYATNTGTRTIRGIVAQLTPKQLCHRGFRI